MSGSSALARVVAFAASAIGGLLYRLDPGNGELLLTTDTFWHVLGIIAIGPSWRS